MAGGAGGEEKGGAAAPVMGAYEERKRPHRACRSAQPTPTEGNRLGACSTIVATSKGQLPTDFFSELVPALGPSQRSIVEESGFRFVLSLPSISISSTESAWCLMIFDEHKSQMVLDDGRSAPVRREDLATVVALEQGRPFHRDVYVDLDFSGKIEEVASMFPQPRKFRRLCNTSCISLDAARKALWDLSSKHLNDAERSIFRSALVLVAAHDLLSPEPYRKQIDARIVQAIMDPAGPQTYNWASFALQGICKAAAELKSQVQHNDRSTKKRIGGCTVFLQLFYFLKFTNCGVSYDTATKPLMGHFTAERIASLVDMDEYRRLHMPSYRIVCTPGQIATAELKCLMKAETRIKKSEQEFYNQSNKWDKIAAKTISLRIQTLAENEYLLLKERLPHILKDIVKDYDDGEVPAVDKMLQWVQLLALDSLKNLVMQNLIHSDFQDNSVGPVIQENPAEVLMLVNDGEKSLVSQSGSHENEQKLESPPVPAILDTASTGETEMVGTQARESPSQIAIFDDSVEVRTAKRSRGRLPRQYFDVWNAIDIQTTTNAIAVGTSEGEDGTKNLKSISLIDCTSDEEKASNIRTPPHNSPSPRACQQSESPGPRFDSSGGSGYEGNLLLDHA